MLQKIKTAVALRYPSEAEAPIITLKEKGALAKRMIEIAKENDIPLVEDETLANVLSVQEIGACVPEETWNVVAKVFAYIKKVENMNAKGIFKN